MNEDISTKPKSDTTTEVLPEEPKVKYKVQNSKIWTINFSAFKYVQRAKIVIPALMKKVSLQSRGLTVLLAVEYCLQERVGQDFLAYVNSNRRELLNKRGRQ